MHHPPETRTGAAARAGRRLLLLLALAACGGGDGDGGSPPARDGQPRTALADSTAAQCAPSPAVNPALLSDSTSWALLTSWRVQSGVAFADANADSTRAWVQLCAGCKPVKLRIVSETRTYCNTPGSFQDTTRIAGVWVVEEGQVSPPSWGATFTPGDSIFVFARDTGSSAILTYPVGGKVHRAPPNAWSFQYCQHRGPSADKPKARWRSQRTDQVVTLASSDSIVVTGPPEDTDPPGTYGWMSCASGCCQFYIPPILEDDEDGPGKGGGSGGGGRPLCPARHD